MRFDLDAAIDSARAKHGAGDFDLGRVQREGLALMAADADASARVEQRLAAYNWISGQVSTQALLHVRRLAQPALRDVTITAPVFIIAPGRTGSTLLQYLLALHPGLRSPALWELWSPLHTEGPASRRQAIAVCKELLRQTPATALKLHPMSPEAPDECHWIMTHNPLRAGFQWSPGYSEWLWSLDAASLTALFRDYRAIVQALQAPHSNRRWLSKTFAHSLFWPVLFDVFPDARVIRLHRDPRQFVASACSLFHHLARGVDPLVMGEGVGVATAAGQARMMAADANAPTGQVVDLLYEDLRDDPARVACELIAWLGGADPDAYADQVRRYLSGARRIRAAPHAPTLEEFGLSDEVVLDYFAPYIDWVRARCAPSFCCA